MFLPAPRCGSDSPHRRSDELGIARVTVAYGLAHLPRGSLCRSTAKEVCMYCTTQDSERYTSRRRFQLLDSLKGGSDVWSDAWSVALHVLRISRCSNTLGGSSPSLSSLHSLWMSGFLLLFGCTSIFLQLFHGALRGIGFTAPLADEPLGSARSKLASHCSCFRRTATDDLVLAPSALRWHVVLCCESRR